MNAQSHSHLLIEKLRAQIINLSQNYSSLHDRIIESRQELNQYQSSLSNFDESPDNKNKSVSSMSSSLESFSYQEDALQLKHLCDNFSRCRKHEVCQNFHLIVKEYRSIEDQFNRVFDAYENIQDKSQICVIQVLIEKLYEQKLQLEEYFS
ncbi:hypothetical protein ABPG74_019037 [Tetrahymena malaccensis]